MPADRLRTMQSPGVRREMNQAERANLHSLWQHPGYPTLIDLLEMVCWEQQALLVNTDPTELGRVAEEHKKTQAMWQMFIHLQERINTEALQFEEGRRRPTPPTFTAEQMEQDELLDATRHYERG